jgi:hypothetical protein
MSPPETVEFLGGPFDGHVYVPPSPSQRLTRYAALPVNESLVNVTSGLDGRGQIGATSIAIYVLESTRRGWRYRFQWAAPPEYFQLEDWVS